MPQYLIPTPLSAQGLACEIEMIWPKAAPLSPLTHDKWGIELRCFACHVVLSYEAVMGAAPNQLPKGGHRCSFSARHRRFRPSKSFIPKWPESLVSFPKSSFSPYLPSSQRSSGTTFAPCKYSVPAIGPAINNRCPQSALSAGQSLDPLRASHSSTSPQPVDWRALCPLLRPSKGTLDLFQVTAAATASDLSER